MERAGNQIFATDYKGMRQLIVLYELAALCFGLGSPYAIKYGN
jgi:hypothetical protein